MYTRKRARKEHIMMQKNNNKFGPTFGMWMNDPGFKKEDDKESKEFALPGLD